MLVYSHIIKNGGTSIVNILRNNFGRDYVLLAGHKIKASEKSVSTEKRFKSILSQIDINSLKKYYRKAGAISGHSIRPYAELDWSGFSNKSAILNVIFLRDPISRFISGYNHYRHKNQTHNLSLAAYLELRKDDTQCNWIAGTNCSKKAYNILVEKNYFVGTLENWDNSLFLLKLKYESIFNENFDITYMKSNSRKVNYLSDNALSQAEVSRLKAHFNEDYKLIALVEDNLTAKYIQELRPDDKMHLSTKPPGMFYFMSVSVQNVRQRIKTRIYNRANIV